MRLLLGCSQAREETQNSTSSRTPERKRKRKRKILFGLFQGLRGRTQKHPCRSHADAYRRVHCCTFQVEAQSRITYVTTHIIPLDMPPVWSPTCPNSPFVGYHDNDYCSNYCNNNRDEYHNTRRHLDRCLSFPRCNHHTTFLCTTESCICTILHSSTRACGD